MNKDLARTTQQIAEIVAARANDALYGLTPEGRRQKQRERDRRRRAMARMARRLILAAIGIVFAAIGWGLIIGPLGILGVVATAMLILLAWVVLLSLPREAAPSPKALAASDLPLLPQRTEEWLIRQRPALPAPAVRIVDSINLQLEALAPQFQTIDPTTPVAGEFRKLVAEELPELIQGYTRVPKGLRADPRGGTAPDRQLVDGLSIVRSELDRMSGQLASGDLDRIATQARYLELKYKGSEDTGN